MLLARSNNPRRTGFMIVAANLSVAVLLNLVFVLATGNGGGHSPGPDYSATSALAFFVGVVVLGAALAIALPRLTLRGLKRMDDTPRALEALWATLLVTAAQAGLAPTAWGFIGGFVFHDWRFVAACSAVGYAGVVVTWPTGARRRSWESALRERSVLQHVEPAPIEGWYPDPAGRHELRHWDGASWAPHVSDAGVRGHDPL
jgi:hypothetical protein